MSTIDLTTTVRSLEITGGGYNIIDVSIEDLDLDDVFKASDAKETVEYYGIDTLLDLIGEDEARKYFGIEEEAK